MATVGTSVTASKAIGAGLEPFLATALRHAIALPVLLLIARFKKVYTPKLSRHDSALLLMQAAAGSVGYTVLLIAATRVSAATDVGIVTGTLPAVAGLFSMLVLKERPSGWGLVGMLMATLGLLTLTAPSIAQQELSLQRLLGLALAMAAVLCEVVFILGQKRLHAELHPLQMAIYMSAGGLFLSAPPAALIAAFGTSALQGSLSGAFAGVVWYALVPTVIGFWLWYEGASRSTGQQASVSTAVLPVAAVLSSAAVLGERLDVHQALALLLIITGVLATAAKK